MRRLLIFFSAFLAALAAGGQVAHAAEGAQIAAASAGTIAAQTVGQRPASAIRAAGLHASRPQDVTLRAFALIDSVPLYAGRRRL